MQLHTVGAAFQGPVQTVAITPPRASVGIEQLVLVNVAWPFNTRLIWTVRAAGEMLPALNTASCTSWDSGASMREIPGIFLTFSFNGKNRNGFYSPGCKCCLGI